MTSDCLYCSGGGRVMVENKEKTSLWIYRCSCPASDKYPSYIKKWDDEFGKKGWEVVKQF